MIQICKQLVILFFTLLLTVSYANATWSIIVIDKKTGEIGIAGASCTYSVYGIGAIIPAKGAIIVQAMSNSAARSKGLQLLESGATPEQIMAAMRNPVYHPEEQQYAVLSAKFPDKPLTYTGTKTTSSKATLTSNSGISVQGNTLTSEEELNEVMNAALKAQKEGLPIEEILMLALEAGAQYGGDKRCGERKAASSFLTIAKPTDNMSKPFINLIVYGNNEDQNAVITLRQKFDQWKKANSGNR